MNTSQTMNRRQSLQLLFATSITYCGLLGCSSGAGDMKTIPDQFRIAHGGADPCPHKVGTFVINNPSLSNWDFELPEHPNFTFSPRTGRVNREDQSAEITISYNCSGTLPIKATIDIKLVNATEPGLTATLPILVEVASGSGATPTPAPTPTPTPTPTPGPTGNGLAFVNVLVPVDTRTIEKEGTYTYIESGQGMRLEISQSDTVLRVVELTIHDEGEISTGATYTTGTTGSRRATLRFQQNGGTPYYQVYQAVAGQTLRLENGTDGKLRVVLNGDIQLVPASGSEVTTGSFSFRGSMTLKAAE